MKNNILAEKSFDFALRIVNLYKYLYADKKEYVMSKQLLRSGTSVGATISESEYSESKADFIHKLSIGQKEINESIYWIRLLHKSNYLADSEFESIYSNADELLRLLTSSIKTAKANLQKK